MSEREPLEAVVARVRRYCDPSAPNRVSLRLSDLARLCDALSLYKAFADEADNMIWGGDERTPGASWQGCLTALEAARRF